MATTPATYVLEVDFDNDGDYADTGEDITGYTREASWTRGRDYASQLTGRSIAGQLTAQLNNADGRFNSFNTASPLYGNLLPGRMVRLRTTAPSATTLWTGYLDRIQPLPDIGGAHRASLTALGPLSRVIERRVAVAMQTAILTGAVIGLILDDAGWSASLRAIDAGQTTLTRWWTDQMALSSMREVEESEAGFIYETADGKIGFGDRFQRLQSPHTVSQATFTDLAGGIQYGNAQQSDPLREIFNAVTSTVRVYSVGGVAALWTLPLTGADSPGVDPGVTATWWASYPNPASTPSAVAVDAWTTPVATTDYVANSAANGGGSNLTADLSIVVSKFSKSMKIEITNNAALTAYLTLLQARGTPITVTDPVTITSEDSASQAKYGKRTFPIAGPWIPDLNTGDDYTKYMLSIYKDPLPVLSIALSANRSASHMTQVLTRDISDRVTIVADNNADLGINEDFFIEHMSHHLDAARIHSVTYECSPCQASSGGFWVLDLSELDVNTKLAY